MGLHHAGRYQWIALAITSGVGKYLGGGMKRLIVETNRLAQLRKQAEARLQGEVLGTSDKLPDKIR